MTINNFPPRIREVNKTSYLKEVLKKVNNGEGYLSLGFGYHIIFNPFLTGYWKKERDRVEKNLRNGIVSFTF
jgi:hypothetical protein